MCPNHFKTSVPTPPASPLMGAITKPHTRQSLKREFITDLISQDKWLPEYTLHPGSPGKRGPWRITSLQGVGMSTQSHRQPITTYLWPRHVHVLDNDLFIST